MIKRSLVSLIIILPSLITTKDHASFSFVLPTSPAIYHRAPTNLLDNHKESLECTSASNDTVSSLSAQFSTLRSLGIDYGLSRTGLAVSTGGYQPQPVAILTGNRTNSTSARLIEQIVHYARLNQVTNLVLGHPLHKNGSLSHQSALTRQFGLELLAQVRSKFGPNVNVTLWDERYSSKEALSRKGIVGKGSHELVDDEAACIILEHYYQALGRAGEGQEDGAATVEILELDQECQERCARIYQESREEEEKRFNEQREERERVWMARKELMERARRERGVETEERVGEKKKKKKKKK